MPKDLIERALHRGEGTKVLDKIVPPPLRFAANDGIAFSIESRA